MDFKPFKSAKDEEPEKKPEEQDDKYEWKEGDLEIVFPPEEEIEEKDAPPLKKNINIVI